LFFSFYFLYIPSFQFGFSFYSFAVFLFSQAQSFRKDLLPPIMYSVDSLVPDSVLGSLPADPVFGEPNPAVFPVASSRLCLCLGAYFFIPFFVVIYGE
jgi:hypothetical protein